MVVGEGPRDPEELEAVGAPSVGRLPAPTALGEVHLTVSELERSLAYYRGAIGLEVLEQGAGRARLGVAGRGLLVLVEHAGARPATGHTGLYHFALLLSSRAALARWLAHAARDRVSLLGLSDHFVSEALYLSDPDGHGIEIYWDRPREIWEGQVAARMTTLPLDVGGLLSELEDPASERYAGLPPDTIIGHVHLKVGAIEPSIAFYRDVLGFALMAQLGMQAAFLGAGGYHHHIGANTWESAGASPPPAGTVALRHATIALPSESERNNLLARLAHSGCATEETSAGPRVRDPSGNAFVLALP
jgi:catechol 2,3-dioxygenase